MTRLTLPPRASQSGMNTKNAEGRSLRFMQSVAARGTLRRARPGCEWKSGKAGRACQAGGKPALSSFPRTPAGNAATASLVAATGGGSAGCLSTPAATLSTHRRPP